jgi:hypothetical protein
MEDIIDIIVTETTNLIEITSQPTDEVIDVNIIDNREDITLNVTPSVVEININSLTGNFGVEWGDITGTLSNQTDLNTALSLKADLVDGKVPSSQLPSYVDDVVEVANYASLPATGEVGKIYITLDTNFIYRWTGSTYVEIKDSSAVWGAITGTLSNQTDLQSALNAKEPTITAGTTLQYWRGDKSWQTLNTTIVPEGTNLYFTDTRARAALSASSPLAYNSGTGVFSIPAATSSQNGYLTSTDWTTFNGKQAALSGTGFVKISGTTISYDNTSYLPLTGGTLTGTLIGTRAEFTTSTLVDGVLVNNGSGRGIRIINAGAGYGLIINNETASSAIPFVIQKSGLDKIYFTDSGAGNFTSSLTASSFVKSGGTSSQYLMADGSVSTLTNPVTGTGTSGIVAKFNGTSSITDSIIYDNGTRVSIGADVTTSNKFTAVASTTSSYAVVAQASGAANGFWATLSGTGEIFRGQTSGGSYFIINNGGNAFLNGNLNVGDFASTSYKLNVVGTANFTGALSGTSATFTGLIVSNTSDVYPEIKTSAVDADAFLGFSNTGDGNSAWSIGRRNTGEFWISTYTGNFNSGTRTEPLKIATSGAATFSSSVTAGSNIVIPSGYELVYGTGTVSILGNTTTNILDFRTNNSTKLYINSAGNVGIGTTPPATLLDVRSSSAATIRVGSVTHGGGGDEFGNLEFFWADPDAAGVKAKIYAKNTGNVGPGGGGAADLLFATETPFGSLTERMRITSGGVVQIGGSATPALTSKLFISRSDQYGLHFNVVSGTSSIIASDDNLVLGTSGAERMRITSGGTLCVGRTTSPSSAYTAAFQEAIAMYINTNGNNMINWFNASGTYISSIVINSASVNYNTSSDYRLKTDLKSFKGLDLVSKINVYDFAWKSDNSRTYGVIAHELQDVLPDAVSGIKDSLNEDGTIKSQGVDYSKIVPVMVQAIKELKAELDTLKNK